MLPVENLKELLITLINFAQILILMNKKRPLILITNDDGVQAKGIQELMQAVCTIGEVVVVAPNGPRSGMSSAITSEVPLRIRQTDRKNNIAVYTCNGTPVDCVKLGINEILEHKPDLVISGINHGSNSAISVLYSGTMGAAFEGCIFGIPSFGISLTNHSPDADFSNAIKYARYFAEKILADGLENKTCLNINIPDTSDIKGIKICSQTEGKWEAEYFKSQDALGNPVYWLTGEFQNFCPNNIETDEWALSNGYVSVVPCKIDVTAYDVINRLKKWEISTPK